MSVRLILQQNSSTITFFFLFHPPAIIHQLQQLHEGMDLLNCFSLPQPRPSSSLSLLWGGCWTLFSTDARDWRLVGPTTLRLAPVTTMAVIRLVSRVCPRPRRQWRGKTSNNTRGSLAKSRAFPDFVWRRACHVTGTESLVAGVNKPLGESSVVWGPVAARSCWRLGWHQSSDDARRQTVVHVQTQQSTRPPCCSVVKEDLV